MPRARSRRENAAPPPVSYRDGVQLGGAGGIVWCDAGRARGLDFVSHALLAPRARHGKLLMTAGTRALLSATTSALPGEVLVTPFGRPFSLGGLRLELFPSGHLPGASSLLFTEATGRRIAYAGDVNPVRSLGEGGEVRGAEVLVVSAPLAHVTAALPPRETVLAQLVERVKRTLELGKHPVVLAPPLGTAQEAMAALVSAGLRVRAHARIHDYALAYPSLGIPLPPPARWNGRLLDGETLFFPIDQRAAATLARIDNRVTIALTGLALDGDSAARLGADHALPLSDHADFDALAEYVEQTGASAVYLTRGFSDPVRQRFHDRTGLRRVRFEALGPPRQMELFS